MYIASKALTTYSFFLCKITCGLLNVHHIMSLWKHAWIIILSHTFKDTQCGTILSKFSCVLWLGHSLQYNWYMLLYSVWPVPRPPVLWQNGSWLLVCTSQFDLKMMTQDDQFGLPDSCLRLDGTWFCLWPSPVFSLKKQLSEKEANTTRLSMHWNAHTWPAISLIPRPCTFITCIHSHVHRPIHWLTYNSFLVTTESTYTAQSSGNLKLCKAPPRAEVLWQDAACLG